MEFTLLMIKWRDIRLKTGCALVLPRACLKWKYLDTDYMVGGYLRYIRLVFALFVNT